MRLSSRFILDNLFLLAAAFLVVAAMTWSAGIAGWVAFGVSAGAKAAALARRAPARTLSEPYAVPALPSA